MHDYLPRNLGTVLQDRLQDYPAVALLGARQTGKSTLAKHVAENFERSMYLDLERESDLNKLRNAEAFFKTYQDHLICLDEIQRVPEIFPLLRSDIDRCHRAGRFLILGSASRDLIRQSSETLAGRLSHLEISPFNLQEIGPAQQSQHWLRGGYPLSFLSRSDQASFTWRQDYIRTFLERDIPQLGFSIPANTLNRFWRMLAHCQGQTLNNSKLADSMGVSSHTIRNYIDLLEQTFVVRTLQPYFTNRKKRQIKSPKVYIRDSGLLHCLLDIESMEDLFANPYYGASFEGYVIENLINTLPKWRPYFYRTSNGAEIDLVLERGQQRVAIEIKASASPQVTRGFYSAREDIAASDSYVVGMIDQSYPLPKDITAIPVLELVNKLA